MTKQLGDAMKAVMSRNIGEFLSATKDNKKEEVFKSDTEEVFLDNASEDVFDKYIKEQVK